MYGIPLLVKWWNIKYKFILFSVDVPRYFHKTLSQKFQKKIIFQTKVYIIKNLARSACLKRMHITRTEEQI